MGRERRRAACLSELNTNKHASGPCRLPKGPGAGDLGLRAFHRRRELSRIEESRLRTNVLETGSIWREPFRRAGRKKGEVASRLLHVSKTLLNPPEKAVTHPELISGARKGQGHNVGVVVQRRPLDDRGPAV